jgi:hypothetical protein
LYVFFTICQVGRIVIRHYAECVKLGETTRRGTLEDHRDGIL